MNSIWYYGTDEQGYQDIAKAGVLKAGSYLTPYFDSAVTDGGEYVFGVVLDMAENTFGEYVLLTDIPLSNVRDIRKINIKLLFYNKEENRKLKDYPDDTLPCETCDGYGDLNYVEDGYQLLPGGNLNKEIINICPDCSGFGFVKVPKWLSSKFEGAMWEKTGEIESLQLELEQMKEVAENATVMASYWKERYVSTQEDLANVVRAVNDEL